MGAFWPVQQNQSYNSYNKRVNRVRNDGGKQSELTPGFKGMQPLTPPAPTVFVLIFIVLGKDDALRQRVKL